MLPVAWTTRKGQAARYQPRQPNTSTIPPKTPRFAGARFQLVALSAPSYEILSTAIPVRSCHDERLVRSRCPQEPNPTGPAPHAHPGSSRTSHTRRRGASYRQLRRVAPSPEGTDRPNCPHRTLGRSQHPGRRVPPPTLPLVPPHPSNHGAAPAPPPVSRGRGRGVLRAAETFPNPCRATSSADRPTAEASAHPDRIPARASPAPSTPSEPAARPSGNHAAPSDANDGLPKRCPRAPEIPSPSVAGMSNRKIANRSLAPDGPRRDRMDRSPQPRSAGAEQHVPGRGYRRLIGSGTAPDGSKA